MADDVFDVTIHDDHTGEVLLHKLMVQHEAEATLLKFDLVRDRPHMALARAVLAGGLRL
jgi:hypothetical protein